MFAGISLKFLTILKNLVSMRILRKRDSNLRMIRKEFGRKENVQYNTKHGSFYEKEGEKD